MNVRLLIRRGVFMDYNNRKKTPAANAKGDTIPWAIVIIMMVFVWPVGLILLFRKLNEYAKHAGNASGNTGWQAPGATHYTTHETGSSTKGAGYSAGNAGYSARDAGYSAGNAGYSARDAGYSAGTAGYSAGKAGSSARYTPPHTAYSASGSGDAIHQTVREVKAAAKGAGATARQAAAQYAGYAKQTASDVFDNISRDFPAPPPGKTKKRKDRNPLEKKSGKFVSVVLLLISIPLFIIGGNFIATAASSFLGSGINEWFSFFMGLFFLTGAFTLFFSRNVGVRRFTRYKNYYAFTAGRGIVPIQDMARAAGVSVRTVLRDIQAMISSGYFGPGAYFNSELNSLVLSPDAAKEARQASRNASAACEAPLPSTDVPVNPYMAIIAELRELNVTIADIPISNKINRIEEITAKIFRIVEENPEKQPQIRRFMSYYLPTTLKLLRSYATLEKQGIKGENITSAKENIGRILDTLATGFEQQLDQLFRADAIDIAADITVLENLMQQDGLSGDKPGFRTMEGSIW